MKFKKLNALQKIILKQKSKEQYKDYKFLRGLQRVTHPDLQRVKKADVHFKHSGNIGDIIYAMPAMYALANGGNIHLHLHINQPANYGKMKHHLGDVMLTQKMVDMLQPLMLQQSSVKTCDVCEHQLIDYDLDRFRDYPSNHKMGHICRWYFLVFAVTRDLSQPWLGVQPDLSYNNAIVVGRSFRYHMAGINYSFLNEYSRIVFVGLPDEFADMKKDIPKLEYVPVQNFLELASVIAGSKFFIGNQSFPFAVAEGLKVKRALEVYHQSPNVIVEGADGCDFCYQPQFEKIVRQQFD